MPILSVEKRWFLSKRFLCLLHISFCIQRKGFWLFSGIWYITAEEKIRGGERFACRRVSFVWAGIGPHVWPSTGLDYVETVRTRAPENIDFGLKGTEKPWKSSKKSIWIYSGRWGRGFDPRRLDQKCRNLSKRQIAAFSFYKVDMGIVIEMNGRRSYDK